MELNENHYNLPNQSDFRGPLKTVYRDSENISCIGPKIWDNIPEKSKESNSIDNCKSQSESGYRKLPLDTIRKWGRIFFKKTLR